MSDIWSGDILLPDGNALNEIILSAQHASSLPIPPCSLRFLSVVDTARIPLYLAIGPSYDVSTTSEEVEQFFSSTLLNTTSHVDATALQDASPQQAWWACSRAQSPVGILVQLEFAELENTKAPRITEILFYGTVANAEHGVLPTPPHSSPQLPHPNPELSVELHIHALPLCSDILQALQLVNYAPPSPPAIDNEPQFLPSLFLPSPPSPKSRKRERDIFEEATNIQKKVRRKGGEGVAAAAAKLDSRPVFPHRKSLSTDIRPLSPLDTNITSSDAPLRPQSRPHSRSPSISSDIRPLSRKGEAAGKKSLLSKTVPLEPEEPTTESRNKEALSRVVMAGMRMYGLQQRKKTSKSRRGSLAPGADTSIHVSEEVTAEEAAKDEEYKLIYHQTFKSAVLALRKHISTKPLHAQPDRLRDIVEKLLAIFCTDPLAEPLHTSENLELLATPSSRKGLGVPRSTHSQRSPFDAPRSAGGSKKEVNTVDTAKSPIKRRET